MWFEVVGKVDQPATQAVLAAPGFWAITLAALLLAWIGRKRLRPAVGETLFVVATSAALVSLYPSGAALGEHPSRSCAVFTALAVLWHIASRWIERSPAGSSPHSASSPGLSELGSVRKLVAEQAVIVCGLVAAAFSWLTPFAAHASERLAVTSALLILAAIALHRRIVATGPLGRYAALALLGCAIRLWLPKPIGLVAARFVGVPLFVLSLGALAVALFPVLEHWQRRRRVWRSEPERLLDPPRAFGGLQILAQLLGMVVGVGGLLGGPAPLSVFIAASAVLTVEHRARREPPAALGLALVAEGIVLAAMGWLPASPANALLGVALAAAFLLWLSRFWNQQLRDGVAWTTAGRLIPVARHLGHAATAAGFALAVTFVVSTPAGLTAPVGLLILLIVALVALGSMLVRAAATSGESFAALAACLAFTAAAVPTQWLLLRYAAGWPLATTTSLLALLLAVRVGAQRESRPADLIYNACLCGALPPLVAYAVLASGATRMPPYALGIAAGCVIGAVALRSRIRRTAPLDATPSSAG